MTKLHQSVLALLFFTFVLCGCESKQSPVACTARDSAIVELESEIVMLKNGIHDALFLKDELHKSVEALGMDGGKSSIPSVTAAEGDIDQSLGEIDQKMNAVSSKLDALKVADKSCL